MTKGEITGVQIKNVGESEAKKTTARVNYKEYLYYKLNYHV